VRTSLDLENFVKELLILRHIEFFDVCMKH
jgi:hypothetical protein